MLDSTVLIDALRGRGASERIRQLRRSGDQAWVCAISIEEIWRGLHDHEEPTARRLFAGLRLGPLQAAQGIQAGRWRRDFAARGITLHQADCLIAAAALGVGARLATGDAHDYPMSEITVETWPVGA